MIVVLENFVKLENEKEKVMAFVPGSFRIEEINIRDPKTKKIKSVRRAAVDVREEDYMPVKKLFSTLSDKLAQDLQAMHINGDLYKYHVGITRHAADFATTYSVRLV